MCAVCTYCLRLDAIILVAHFVRPCALSPLLDCRTARAAFATGFAHGSDLRLRDQDEVASLLGRRHVQERAHRRVFVCDLARHKRSHATAPQGHQQQLQCTSPSTAHGRRTEIIVGTVCSRSGKYPNQYVCSALCGHPCGFGDVAMIASTSWKSRLRLVNGTPTVRSMQSPALALPCAKLLPRQWAHRIIKLSLWSSMRGRSCANVTLLHSLSSSLSVPTVGKWPPYQCSRSNNECVQSHNRSNTHERIEQRATHLKCADDVRVLLARTRWEREHAHFEPHHRIVWRAIQMNRRVRESEQATPVRHVQYDMVRIASAARGIRAKR